MGEEFCKGCEDCTNFNHNEGNLSHFANKPVKNLSNPFFANGTMDNSLLNKTDFQNDTSFHTKDYNNNNLNNPTKNETLQISSFKSKCPDDMAQNNLNNQRFYKDESENFFKNMNNIMSKEESYLNNSYNNENNNNNYNNYNTISNNDEEEIDKDRLNEIIKN